VQVFGQEAVVGGKGGGAGRPSTFRATQNVLVNVYVCLCSWNFIQCANAAHHSAGYKYMKFIKWPFEFRICGSTKLSVEGLVFPPFYLHSAQCNFTLYRHKFLQEPNECSSKKTAQHNGVTKINFVLDTRAH